jgi:hypothetical protein
LLKVDANFLMFLSLVFLRFEASLP